jgi:hypothetical protein
MATQLDPKTLRWVARRLDARAELLLRCHERKGWRSSHHFVHRAAELESVAMGMTAEARAIESAAKRKGAKR